MKKKDFTISQLKVKSFVTATRSKALKGGAQITDFCGNTADPCATFDFSCPTLLPNQTLCSPCGGGTGGGGTGLPCEPQTTPQNCIY